MKVEPASSIDGAIAVPGVKGISQRAVLLGAIADGESRIEGFGRAADTETAISVVRQLGVEVDEDEPETVRVHVPDRAGVLAAITQGLGAERINIEDFELQHLSPERGGVLMLLISGEREANRAAELLEQQGYGVVVSPIIDE